MNTTPQKLLRLSDVLDKTGLSRAMLYKLMKEDSFPLNVQISKRSVGWVESEIEGWMEQKLNNKG